MRETLSALALCVLFVSLAEAQPGRPNRPGSPNPGPRQQGLAPPGVELPLGAGGRRGEAVRRLPSPEYFISLQAVNAGEFLAAKKHLDFEINKSVKVAINTPWVDSLCYHAMMAEVCYQTGAMREALEANTRALALLGAYARWMNHIRTFNPVVGPVPPSMRRRCPWGVSSRQTVPADAPSFVVVNVKFRPTIVTDDKGTGRLAAFDTVYSLSLPEMLRVSALTLRRHREWLGAAAADDPFFPGYIRALEGDVFNSKHWAGAPANVLLGLAYSAVGRNREATEALVQGTTITGGQLDHPLTAAALYELGRLELARGAVDAAKILFMDASVSAFEYWDAELIEESLRAAWLAHRMSNVPGVYPPLAFAIEWAKTEKLTKLAASLLLLQAESHLASNDLIAAAACLAEVERLSVRNNLKYSRVAADAKRISAATAFRQGDPTVGQAALGDALAFMEQGSIWRIQIAAIDKMAASTEWTPRQLSHYYSGALHDPTPADWLSAPLETLSYLSASTEAQHLAWFQSHWAKNEGEAMLEVADRVRRERFYDALPLGGRLNSLRWTLHYPDPIAPNDVQLERGELMIKQPAYAAVAKEVEKYEKQLETLPITPAVGEDTALRNALVDAWGAASELRESVLLGAAVDRVPCSSTWPPLRTVKTLQSHLKAREGVLVFFAGPTDYHGFLIRREDFESWLVGPIDEVNSLAIKFLADLGVSPAVDAIDERMWNSLAWKDSSRKLFTQLTKGMVSEGWMDELDELAVVPDGTLWYVPFELLNPTLDADKRPLDGTLGARFLVRYAPTAGLAVCDAPARPILEPTVLLTGKPTSRDAATTAQELATQLATLEQASLSLAPADRPKSPAATLRWGRLITFDAIDPPARAPHDWSFAKPLGDSPSMTMNVFLSLPPIAPTQVLLPGFSTQIERLPDAGRMTLPPGRELFNATMALQAAGVRTALVSRWRTGGRNAADLLREFVQELPHTTPTEAWQRAVLLSHDWRLDPALEPRVRWGNAEPPKADHPFLWSGYMLVDPGQPPQ